MSTNVVIHFGLAKTATTYLQSSVFPNTVGINYMGKPFLTRRSALIKSLIQLKLLRRTDWAIRHEKALRHNDFHMSEEKKKCVSEIRSILKRDTVNVWSHEGVLRPTRRMYPLDVKSVFKNFKEVYEDAGASSVHAMFVTREPYKHFVSYTRQFFHEIESLRMERFSFDDIVKAVELGRKDTIEWLFWDLWYSYFDFSNYETLGKNIFGVEKAKFFVYEELIEEKFKPLSEWFKIIDDRLNLNFPEVHVNVTNNKKKCTKVENFLSSICEERFNSFYRSRH